jgi:hypothetical protein
MCLFLGVSCFFRDRWLPFGVGWRFGRLPGENADVELCIWPERLAIKTDLGDARFTWRSYIKAIGAPEGMLLSLRESMWNWLPRHAFASDEEFERVLGWAEKSIPVHRSR